jgi:predicted HicB family RNase H-like nuclease
MSLEYKGYTVEIKCSVDTNTFVGEVVNCRETISFVASKQEDLFTVFKLAVDQYLEMISEECYS